MPKITLRRRPLPPLPKVEAPKVRWLFPPFATVVREQVGSRQAIADVVSMLDMMAGLFKDPQARGRNPWEFLQGSAEMLSSGLSHAPRFARYWTHWYEVAEFMQRCRRMACGDPPSEMGWLAQNNLNQAMLIDQRGEEAQDAYMTAYLEYLITELPRNG